MALALKLIKLCSFAENIIFEKIQHDSPSNSS